MGWTTSRGKIAVVVLKGLNQYFLASSFSNFANRITFWWKRQLIAFSKMNASDQIEIGK